MYTRCPDCTTVFRVSAAQLRMAAGTVRCGRCGTLFNALDCAGDTPAEVPAAPPEPDSATPELWSAAAAGSTSQETSGDADGGNIAMPDKLDVDFSATSAFLGLADAAAAPADEPARDAPDAVWRTAETSLSDTLSAIDSLRPPDTAPGGDSEIVDDDFDPEPWLAREVTGPDVDHVADDAPAAEHDSGTPPGDPYDTAAHFAEKATETDPNVPSDPEAGDGDSNADTAAAGTDGFEEQITPPAARFLRGGRLAAATGAAAILLVAQLVHHSRSTLARAPVVGPAVSSVYAAFGVRDLWPASPAHYTIEQNGMVSGPGEGTLTLRATVTNATAHRQRFPIVRVALDNRWGRPVAARHFIASEYLATPAGSGRMRPGEQVDALLHFEDPGEEAFGFRIDVCVASPHGTPVCAEDVSG